jgi:hypothetical protein
LHVTSGSGRFLRRAAGETAKPIGRPSAEFAHSMATSKPAQRASTA